MVCCVVPCRAALCCVLLCCVLGCVLCCLCVLCCVMCYVVCCVVCGVLCCVECCVVLCVVFECCVECCLVCCALYAFVFVRGSVCVRLRNIYQNNCALLFLWSPLFPEIISPFLRSVLYPHETSVFRCERYFECRMCCKN